ncbi:hypothetical protein [Cellulomonas sp. B6]|uniref:hypothetical protein n=1 Tax=Cellulomonas sp. B6 TaxID=1295626 RepID=UPI00073B3310|nr:hypothetical protein [Cellulomonas sp. B6]KSW29573.1 hypothetical protein ATM99_07420 [Cellulomonas sp. B6]
MTDDLVRRLRAADPAARAALPATGDDAMREAIMTTTDERTAPARVRTARARRWRRGGIAAGLSVALLGGGAAVAAYQGWYVSSGDSSRTVVADGVLCTADWSTWDDDGGATSGPLLTGDPVLDCQRYQHESGRAAIADPAAFWTGPGGEALWVAPADQVPADARVQDDWSEQIALRELVASVNDWVDGLQASCTPVDAAVPVVTEVAHRLGLDDWSVLPAPDQAAGGCASVVTGVATREIWVVATPRSAWGSWVPAEPVVSLRDGLRAGVAETCVDLDAATAVAVDALGGEHHWPVTSIEDPTATCTRVDLEVGGSILVTLRGPRG